MLKKLVLLKNDLKNINNEDPIILLNYYYFFEFFEKINNKNYQILNHYTKGKDYSFYFKECKSIYDSIAPDFCREFNKIHLLDYSDESSKIIFGAWLQQFIEICYERFHSIKKLFLEEKVQKVKIIDSLHFNLATTDHVNIYENSLNEGWNFVLISKIISFFKFSPSYEVDNNVFKVKNFDNNENFKNNIKNKKIKIINYLFYFLNKLKKKNFLIYQSYLKFLDEKKLEIYLKQFPSFLNFSYDISEKFNHDKRKNINLNKSKELTIENFIRFILPSSIPVSFIESFERLKKETFNFPQGCKFICSANAFEMNSLFKIYSAEQREKKSKIISIQHGSGSSLLPNSYLSKDYEFCDKFITWGHKDNPKDIQLFNIKTINKVVNYKKDGFLNVVLQPPGKYTRLFDRHLESFNVIKFVKYLEDSFDTKIKQNIVLKTHSNFNLKKFNIKIFDYYRNFFDQISFKKIVNKNFYEIANLSRLNLFTYNSTGILESLSLKIPTLCYWKDGYNAINNKYFYKFKLLENAKIFFTDKKKLITHIKEIWNNVDKWWLNPKTLSAIETFNSGLNLTFKGNPIKELSNKLKNLN